MDSINNKKARIGVILFSVNLFSIVFLFEYVTHATAIFNWLMPILLLSLIVIFVMAFIKTGLWRFTHKNIDELDEREVALTAKASKTAYAIFSIFIIVLLFVNVFMGLSLSIVGVVCLLLFAHILPASIIVWTQNRIDFYE
ncbi:MAG: hypothetical protein KAH25_07720 [Bacteroidales bacterium]|nr:hypothetical protein [Bacteroidales bacterium]